MRQPRYASLQTSADSRGAFTSEHSKTRHFSLLPQRHFARVCSCRGGKRFRCLMKWSMAAMVLAPASEAIGLLKKAAAAAIGYAAHLPGSAALLRHRLEHATHANSHSSAQSAGHSPTAAVAAGMRWHPDQREQNMTGARRVQVSAGVRGEFRSLLAGAAAAAEAHSRASARHSERACLATR